MWGDDVQVRASSAGSSRPRKPTYRRAIADLSTDRRCRSRDARGHSRRGYYAYDKVDETAIDDGEIALVCCVRIRGSEIEVDVTGSDPAHDGA